MRLTSLSREHQGPRAVLNAVERLVGGYGPETNRVGEDLALAESQLRDYQAQLGVNFAHENYLAELTELRDQLRAGLSGREPEAEKGGLTIAELAGQIRTLKASQTIDATPQRRAADDHSRRTGDGADSTAGGGGRRFRCGDSFRFGRAGGRF